MNPRYRDDPAAREQFLNEATITAKLRHPGIAPIFGLVHDNTDDSPAYAMELIEVPNLTIAIENYRALDVRALRARREVRRKLLGHFVAACRIVAYAHDEHVVHGDIKPSNILTDDKFGATWLVDWGLARDVKDDEDQTEGPVRESPTTRLGTRSFRGPSFHEGAPATFASDIHALGVTLALILAGPHSNLTPTTDVVAIYPTRDVPPALWAIARKAMHTERAGRYISANALAGDVENILNDQPVSAYRDPWNTIMRRWIGRHRTATTAGGLSALIVIIGITSLALISAARDREALRANEASQYREEATKNKADLFISKSNYLYITMLKPPGNPDPTDPAELIRSLLRVLELRDQDPTAVSRTARAYLNTLDRRDEGETKRKEDARISASEHLREGISIFEKLTQEFPAKKLYRVLLARYYLMAGLMETTPVTNLAEYEALLAGRGHLSSEAQQKLEVALTWYDKALTTLPPDADDVHKEWYTSWVGRATILMQLVRFTESLLAWDQAVSFADGPEKAQWLSIRLIVLKAAESEQARLPWSRPPQADHTKAIRMAEALADREEVSPAAIYNAACAFSLASLDAMADEAECRRRADHAMTYLQRIAANGYFQHRARGILSILSMKDTLYELFTDHDLDPLRNRPDFKILTATLTAEAESSSATPARK